MRVVFTPEFLARGLSDPACIHVLHAWRDGAIQPIVSRELVVEYARVLGLLGLDAQLVRRWLWWFGSAERAVFDRLFESGEEQVAQKCTTLAEHADAVVVFSSSCQHDAAGRPNSWCVADKLLL